MIWAIDGDVRARSDDGGCLFVTDNTGDGREYAIAFLHVDPRDINDPVAEYGGRLIDMDPNLTVLIERLVADWTAAMATGGAWPQAARLYPAVTGIVADYEARRSMAVAIHQADKGTGFDASPSYVRDRYMLLAEAALRHAAGANQTVAVVPVAAGWRDGVIAVNADFDDLDPPAGFDRLYRVADVV